MEKKTNNSKWAKKGINPQEYQKMYNRLRARAKDILKKRYRAEFDAILKDLVNKEYSKKNK